MGPKRVLIRGGALYDGQSSEPRQVDLVISGDKIESVGPAPTGHFDRVIDATGRVVAPGFVDSHTHSDFSAFFYPDAGCRVHAGVTTEVIGNCGMGAFPLAGEAREQQRENFARHGVELTWGDFAEFLDAAGKHPYAVNRVPLMGHGTLRTRYVGREDRGATGSEVREMTSALEAALDGGAWGLSTGLIYPPGCYTPTDEIARLAEVTARRGGVYASHIRSEGDRIEEALEEFAEIARTSGARAIVSHLKLSKRRNWSKMGWLIEFFERLHAEGLCVEADRYPYAAGSTVLGIVLPEWVHEGGREAACQRLADPGQREEIRAEIAADVYPEFWSEIVVAGVWSEESRDCEGLNLVEIAQMRSAPSPFDAAVDLLLRERMRVDCVFFRMSEANLETILRLPFVGIGSDSEVRSLEAKRFEGKPHPRCFGTAPRVLGRFVRERGVLTLGEAIVKMTGKVAGFYGLKDRGGLAPGLAADVIVFDPDSVADTATYEEPYSYAVGFDYVFVNGEPVLDGGAATELRPGRMLLRG
jgi:N-acyl-D-amino-acid deacylase